MEEFNAELNRDAYAVIRGFVYQVDWTILRWCELREHEHLELECGEDIDIVARALETEVSECSRTLEQVKHRERSVTLVSPDSLTAVANFLAHRQDNPTQKIRFRFCTSARVGLERSDLFDGQPGIEVWETLRTRDLTSRRDATELETLRRLFDARPTPSPCREEIWQRFQSWLENADQQQLAELVGDFEWAVGRPHADSMADEVRRELYLKGLCQEEATARELHARLFLRVMRLLSQKGSKSLDRRQLHDEATLPTMRDDDRRLLRFLTAKIFTFGARLREVEKQVVLQRESQHRMLLELAALTREVSSTRVSNSSSLPLSLQAPPPPDKPLQRKEVADSMESSLAESHWLALRGATGAGKTQMASLLYYRCTAKKLWLSLGGLDEAQVAHQVASLLRRLSTTSPPDELTSLVESAIGLLPEMSLIVFDDLPFISVDGQLSTLLGAIANACARSGVYLITTSHYEIEQSCSSTKPAARRMIPPLTSPELRELLALHGAPDEVIKGQATADLLNTTHGHPWLTAAAVGDLKSRSWKPRHRDETPQCESEFASIITATLKRLLESVRDELARDMLYRLSRVTGAFSTRIVNAVSAAPPSIDKPRERFLKAEGPWIERHAIDEYSVTPLISPISETELTSDVATAVYEALAEEVTTREALSVVDVDMAIDYLTKSGQVQQAALLALHAFLFARELPAEDLRYLLDAAWRSQEIPEGVSLTVRLCLRTQHILLSDEPEEGFLYAAAEASKLMRSEDDTAAWAKASLVVLGSLSLAEHDFSRACLHIRLLMPLRRLVAEQLPNVGDAVGYAIWTIVGWIATPKQLLDWLRCVKSLDKVGVALAFGWEPAIEGCGVAINGPWTSMHLADTPPRKWRQLFRVYRAAASIAIDMNIDMLWSSSVVAQVIVAAEYLDDLPLAELIAQDALARDSLSKPSEFLIREALGRQYLYHDLDKLAVKQLELALSIDIREYPAVRTRTHLELGSLLGKGAPALGVSCAEQSVDLARSEPMRVSEESLVVSLGELAIANWLQGDLLRTFVALDEAAERLFATKEANFDVRNVASRLGHCITYFSTLALTGEPPEGQRYSVRPFRRFMMGWSSMVADHYDERDFSSHHDSIYVSLAGLAVVVGSKQRATYWSELGWEEARRNGHLIEQGLAGHASFAVLLTKSEYEPALDRVRQAMNANWAVHVLRHKKLDLHSRRTAKAVLGSQPNHQWHGAERWAIQQGLLPVLLQIGANHLEGLEDASAAIACVSEYIRGMDDAALWEEWTAAYRFVESPWCGDSTWESIKLEAERWSEAESGGTRYLGLLSATLHPNIPLPEAAVLHARIMAYISKQFGVTSGVNEWVSVRFFDSYWRGAAKHLQGHACMERSLEESASLACDQRLRAIARAALAATGAKLPNGQKAARDWLRSYQ